MEVLINNELPDQGVSTFEELIEEGFAIAARLEGLTEPWEVSVSFVDDETIGALNAAYRQIDAPTDVLSFPQDDDWEELEGLPRVLGDIVISLERASAQAQEYGHSLEREVVFLAVHGFFHLLGYDHETEEEERLMQEKQERVLKELNLGRD